MRMIISKRAIDYANSARLDKKSGLFNFLNRTCYNGLYRLNRKGEFNVPFGRYKKPVICDAENLIEVTRLCGHGIICGDFEESRKYVRKNTLVYLDPLSSSQPYFRFYKL